MNIILGICALVSMLVLIWFVFDTRKKINFIYYFQKSLLIRSSENEVQSEEKPDYKKAYPQGCTTGDDEDDR